ncbi:HlyD family efflux transporter periplasmic adaptor subunit [Piscinibacter sp. XHJ-5]|uniref:efflux RND transporter periplasmic adaptor subunit n=1 Tax=Piscinibacter sp. XHJ-5 TaxID=3037797 RepID=UPI002453391E|nr:HlyD family efflux transporter periplasmic adaptor subunit [Piscinibacter sp. XHJ-5]
MDSSVQPLLTLLQLGRRARSARELAELGFVAVNETVALVPYRQAALWSALGLPRVQAVSGVPQPDPTAPFVQWLTALCRHLADSAAPSGEIDTATLPARLLDAWDQWLPLHAMWLPLQRDAAPDGALLLARGEPWSAAEMALLRELADVFAHALAGFRPRQHGIDRMLGWWRSGKSRRRLWLAAAALCVFPMRIDVLGAAEVVPRQPLLVRAPLDGVVERFEVRPNQPVKAGQVLFSLDTTALRTRHEVARKAYDTAQEELRQSAQAAVTDEKQRADIMLRRSQLQEKQVELDFTVDQLDRVQVKAEREGIAVFADVNDWLGKAVSVGERILLVADPTQVELTAYLPAADHIELQPGDALTLYPQGEPLASFQARIQSVAYRAEPSPAGHLAYRIKAEFLAAQPLPRLGQVGTARVRGPWAPLLYVVLRRPFAALRQWSGL